MSVFNFSILTAGCGALVTLIDQLFFIDAAGYAAAGPTVVRYLLVLAAVLALWKNSRRAAAARHHEGGFSRSSALPLAASAVFWASGAVCAILTPSGMRQTAKAGLQTSFHILYAAALAAGCVWFVLLSCQAKRQAPVKGAGLTGGICAATASLMACMMRYVERPASNAHVELTLGLLGSIAGMLFVTSLLRTVVLPLETIPRSLAFTASLCLLAAGVVCMGILGSGIAGSASQLMYDLPLVGSAMAAVEVLPRGSGRRAASAAQDQP